MFHTRRSQAIGSGGSQRNRLLAAAVLPAACITMLLAALIAPARQSDAEDPCSIPPPDGCFVRPQRDVAFIVDASSSIENLGQTYNSAVEGIIRAVKDPTTVRRDGSVGIAVVFFNDAPRVAVPLTSVNSNADADQIAATLEQFKCSAIHTKELPCPFGGTSYSGAIQAADANVNKTRQANPKPGARRAYVLITDGEPEDPDLGVQAATDARNASLTLGIPFEFDAILMGLDPSSERFQTSKSRVDQLVFPAPTSDLPGATLAVNAGECNAEGANFGSDCGRQSSELAELARTIIRGPVPAMSLNVTTETDSDSGGSTGDNSLSLRRAIELANCNGGAATIKFDDGLDGKTISLNSPLPALTQPDIIIDGCTGDDCTPAVTIDGAGQFPDGLLLRSNRDIVRGLRMINFNRAGIAIEPSCPNDAVGHNRIELNHLESNPIGVLVAQGPDQVGSINVRNAISRNMISRAGLPSDAPPVVLIDLNGDGPTANDAGDGDQGPNTLLNFPDSLSVVTGEGDTVTVMGKLNTPPSSGAVVEIYAVTSFRTVDGVVVIDGAGYLATAASDENGMVVATGVEPSPTGVYTALVLDNRPSENPADQSGNTSELMFDSPATPLPKPKASIVTSVDFGESPTGTPKPQPVDIVNDGTAPLIIEGCSIGRCPGADSDNSDQFSVSDCPLGPVDPGEKATITVTFNAKDCGAASACLILQTNDPFQPVVAIPLTGIGTAPGHAVVEGGVTSLKFKRIAARGTPRSNPKSATFTVNNTGCSELSVLRANLLRVSGSTTGADDSNTFGVVPVGSQTAFPVVIPARGSVTFNVLFNPIIPAVVGGGTPAVKNILPDDVTDQLTLEASNGESVSLTLLGRIKKKVVLIDPKNPANQPVVTLCRSGNNFVVEFSVYDSNLNVSTATYQFFDGSGRPVNGAFRVDLQQAIASSNAVKGQSFTIEQKFSGASDNSRVASVDVTVSDAETSVRARSTNVGTGCASSTNLTGITSLRIVMPNLDLARVRKTQAMTRAINYVPQVPKSLAWFGLWD